MAWNKIFRGKKGEEAGGEILWFALFYSFLTLAVSFFVVIAPASIMLKSTQPVPLDQSVQAQIITTRLWQTNQFTGRTTPFYYTTNLTGINETYTKKQMSYRVALDGQETYYNKLIYNMAKPIAPYRYLPLTILKTVTADGQTKILIIEEYYPKEYEIKP